MALDDTDDAVKDRSSGAADDTAEEEGFPWPPTNRPPGQTHLRFLRTSYNLEISDPSSRDTIVVKVGSDPTVSTCYIHAEALRGSSDFFKRALKPEWTMTSSRLIHLPDVDPALFDLYARWLGTGAAIMIDEDDWKAEYTEYLRWRNDLEHDRASGNEKKPICPVTVWDFDLTTEAWFLGGFLQSHDFQNHCIGHLYYMHLRFDRLLSNKEYREETIGWLDEFWHCGTIAFIQAKDVLFTWRMTEHCNGETPFLLEQHPLRKFYIAWLKRYWDAYALSDWNYEAQDGIVKLIEQCHDLVYEHLRNCMVRGETRRDVSMDVLGSFWVDIDVYSEATKRKVQNVDKTAGTHWRRVVWRAPRLDEL
ncbi:Nn.00g036320.m01.CDS01 [Neocucurbitaria sp. VM-36]